MHLASECGPEQRFNKCFEKWRDNSKAQHQTHELRTLESWKLEGPLICQLGWWTSNALFWIMDNSYPGQLVPKTTRTQDHSYPRQLVPRTTRTQDNSYPRRLVPRTTRTQDNSYPGQLVPYSLAMQALVVVKGCASLRPQVTFSFATEHMTIHLSNFCIF